MQDVGFTWSLAFGFKGWLQAIKRFDPFDSENQLLSISAGLARINAIHFTAASCGFLVLPFTRDQSDLSDKTSAGQEIGQAVKMLISGGDLALLGFNQTWPPLSSFPVSRLYKARGTELTLWGNVVSIPSVAFMSPPACAELVNVGSLTLINSETMPGLSYVRNNVPQTTVLDISTHMSL